MSLLGRSWFLVTAIGCVLLGAGAITVTQWTIATEVVSLLVIAAHYDVLEREQR